MAGDEILRFEGPVLGFKDLPRPYTAEDDYYLQIGDNRFIGPSGGFDDYVNHSCEPNSGIRFKMGQVKLIAISAIEPGDQITFDYSTTMHHFEWKMSCACGSKNCRRWVKNFIELPIKIQDKYIKLGIIPDYILNCLDR